MLLALEAEQLLNSTKIQLKLLHADCITDGGGSAEILQPVQLRNHILPEVRVHSFNFELQVVNYLSLNTLGLIIFIPGTGRHLMVLMKVR